MFTATINESALAIATWFAFCFLSSCVDAPECRVGSVRRCELCPSKEQTCGGNPTVWSPCSCPPSFAGEQCENDGQCGPDEGCWRSANALLDGAPPGGLCAIDCRTDAEVCPAGSRCVQTSGSTSLCLQSCALGGAGCPANENQVCTQRVEGLLCDGSQCALGGDEGLCRPLCVDDEDCEGLGVCNRSTGACDDSADSGQELGSACANDGDCEGFCLNDGTSAFCTHSCIYQGESSGLGYCDFDEAGQARGYCGLKESEQGRLGDGAYCTPLCAEDGDCPTGMACQSLELGPTGVEASATGHCVPGGNTNTSDGVTSADGITSMTQDAPDADAGMPPTSMLDAGGSSMDDAGATP